MREAGLASLESVNGDEALKLGALSVSGTVNRTPIRVRDGVASRDGKLDFEVIGMTEIEVRMSVLPTEPQAGQAFYDSIGLRHRIQKVVFTDLTWVCYCLPSRK